MDTEKLTAGFTPCDYCEAWKHYPTTADGVTTACDNCNYCLILRALEEEKLI